MPKIYSTFSNPGGDLDSLKEEFSGLFHFFNSGAIKRKVDFGFSLNDTVDTITSEIIAGQKEIRLFHFSGHSNHQGLDFAGEDFDAEHIATFFNTLTSDETRIDCVLLNGCENADIVNRLLKVPVVIGTRSPIKDNDAGKFTLDFFNALIASGQTYHKAFEIAASALKRSQVSDIGPNRGESGGKHLRKSDLNDYFIIVNEASVADRTFPAKKPPVSWTKYLLFFFVAVAALIGFLFRDPVFQLLKGYSCASIRVEEGKCNFVIGNIVNNTTLDDPIEWLFQTITQISAKEIRDQLNPTKLNLDKVVSGKVGRNNLPELCGYDFNITGRLLQEGTLYHANIHFIPYTGTSDSVFEYSVESLRSFDSLDITLDETNARQYLLNRICLACAHQGKLTIGVIREILNTFPFSSQSAEAYQSLQSTLSQIALQQHDTTLAIQALDAIIEAAPNDFALHAFENKIQLYQKSDQVRKLYELQSRYLTALEARSTTPSQYILKKPPGTYKQAAEGVRLTRADLVIKHRAGALKEYTPQATQDFQHLDQMKYKDKSYDREIRVLREQEVISEFNPVLHTSPVPDQGGAPGLIAPMTTPLHFQIMTQPTIVLTAYQVDGTKFQKVLNSLKESGYNLSTEASRRLPVRPANLPARPVVLFYHQEYAEKAGALAGFMKDRTGISFRTRQVAPGVTAQLTTAPHHLFIYWPG